MENFDSQKMYTNIYVFADGLSETFLHIYSECFEHIFSYSFLPNFDGGMGDEVEKKKKEEEEEKKKKIVYRVRRTRLEAIFQQFVGICSYA